MSRSSLTKRFLGVDEMVIRKMRFFEADFLEKPSSRELAGVHSPFMEYVQSLYADDGS